MRIERVVWDGSEPGELAASLRSTVPALEGLTERVAQIIERVRAEGDSALLDLSAELDGVERPPSSLRVPATELEGAWASLDPELAAAMELAAENIRAVAEAELRLSIDLELPQGHEVSVVERPVESAGIYAPGGRAAYPSSVLMGAIPARVAGVARVVLVTPPGPDGRPAAVTLAASHVAGVDEVYAVGGAHAVAALAIGTDAIAPVAVIAGPGNAWVTEAKRQLYGIVGIDGLAGPSELVVIAGTSANPREIALDALAQAEHGPDSPIVVASDSATPLDEIARELEALAVGRPSVTDAPFTLVEAPTLDHALRLSDEFAPEHLELRFAGAAERAPARVAGCVFVGDRGATAFGDYVAGSNHVLPTGGAARFSGPLGVGAFHRRMSIVDIPASAAAQLAGAVDALAKSEGLPVHGESAVASSPRKTDDLQVP